MVNGWPSRRQSKPAIASTSALVNTTALIGLLRGPPLGSGCSSGVSMICCLRSGAALSSTHWRPSALTATEACVRGLRPGMRLRTSAELRPLQFHCGNPPPAAEPRTLINMARSQMAGERRFRQGQKAAPASAAEAAWLELVKCASRLPGEFALKFQGAVGGGIGQPELHADIEGKLHMGRTGDLVVVTTVLGFFFVVATRVPEQGRADAVILSVPRARMG